MPQLALGTAQFGLDYGITNSTGKVSLSTARDLLRLAHQSGVIFIDTAQAYGNAEVVLGKIFPEPNPFHLISKLPSQSCEEVFDSACQVRWQESLDTTLERLHIKQLDSLLLHSPSDLSRPDSHYLLKWLRSIRRRGQVRRIGVSIYSASDLKNLPLSDLQLVQLPCSLFDQRLITDGTIHKLRSSGIAVHARSLYLQGLLVTPPERWPEALPTSLRQHHEHFYAWAQSNGFSLVQLALTWARRQAWMEAAVVGITTAVELEELCTSWSGPDPWEGRNPDEWAWPSGFDLDPRHWAVK